MGLMPLPRTSGMPWPRGLRPALQGLSLLRWEQQPVCPAAGPGFYQELLGEQQEEVSLLMSPSENAQDLLQSRED